MMPWMIGCESLGLKAKDPDPIPSDGCEWSIKIGLSDRSIIALREAQDDPDNTPQETRLVRRDREKIAEQDTNYLANCSN